MVFIRPFLHRSTCLAFNACRGLQTTQTLLLRGRNKQLAASQPAIDENAELDEDCFEQPRMDFLENVYDNMERDRKDEKKLLKKIMTKRKFFKQPMHPNMLTSSERQQIKFLHAHNPEEWTPERLSESFPALPDAIRKILKNYWQPSNLEKMKKKDAKVLKNWEKLKENKLVAPEESIAHLKKFIDRRENLKVQLENPKFFSLPEKKENIQWRNGEMGALLEKYEREVENLKLLKAKQWGWLSESSKVDSVSMVGPESEKNLKKVIEMERESQNVTEGSFLIGQKIEDKKTVTLERLKETIKQKSNKETLSMYEEAIINDNFRRTTDDPKLIAEESYDEPEKVSLDPEKYEEIKKLVWEKETKSSGANDELEFVGEDLSWNNGEIVLDKKMPKDENEFEKMFKKQPAGNTKVLFEGQSNGLFLELNDRQEEKPESSLLPPRRKKVPVKYYKTQKDNDHFNDEEKMLSETGFWNSPKKKNPDLSPVIDTPHVSSQTENYFTYDYPERIHVPKDKRKSGLLFKFKDCYYDDDGTFLYRVPGMMK